MATGRRGDPGGASGRAAGWRAYFRTDPTATVADALGLVADRFRLEITLREVEEVVGAGQRQTRFHGRWAWKREILGDEILAALRARADEAEIHAPAERLLDLAA